MSDNIDPTNEKFYNLLRWIGTVGFAAIIFLALYFIAGTGWKIAALIGFVIGFLNFLVLTFVLPKIAGPAE